MARCHDDGVTSTRCFKAGALAGPAEQDGIVLDADGAKGGFFPRRRPCAVCWQLRREAVERPAQQVVRRVQAFGFHEGTGRWGVHPGFVRQLVAAEMNDAKGEEFSDFASRRRPHAPALRHGRVHDVLGVALNRNFLALVLGISARWVEFREGEGMGGDFDLGHDLDAQGPSVLHHTADVSLGVTAATPRAATKDAGHQFAFTPEVGAVQLWQAFKLQAEGFIIGKVPVKAVEFEHGHDVEQTQDEVDLIEMPRAVQMLATPLKARTVFDDAARNHAVVVSSQ